MNEIEYTCPNCGATVRFFEGFVMECKSRPNRETHVFAPPGHTNAVFPETNTYQVEEWRA